MRRCRRAYFVIYISIYDLLPSLKPHHPGTLTKGNGEHLACPVAFPQQPSRSTWWDSNNTRSARLLQPNIERGARNAVGRMLVVTRRLRGLLFCISIRTPWAVIATARFADATHNIASCAPRETMTL